MSYTLVTDKTEDVTVWYLENPDGEKIAEYESKPSHPSETADDVLSDIDDPIEAVKYHLQRRWDFRTERK